MLSLLLCRVATVSIVRKVKDESLRGASPNSIQQAPGTKVPTPSHAENILTWNLDNFRRVGPEAAKRVRPLSKRLTRATCLGGACLLPYPPRPAVLPFGASQSRRSLFR